MPKKDAVKGEGLVKVIVDDPNEVKVDYCLFKGGINVGGCNLVSEKLLALLQACLKNDAHEDHYGVFSIRLRDDGHPKGYLSSAFFDVGGIVLNLAEIWDVSVETIKAGENNGASLHTLVWWNTLVSMLHEVHHIDAARDTELRALLEDPELTKDMDKEAENWGRERVVKLALEYDIEPAELAKEPFFGTKLMELMQTEATHPEVKKHADMISNGLYHDDGTNKCYTFREWVRGHLDVEDKHKDAWEASDISAIDIAFEHGNGTVSTGADEADALVAPAAPVVELEVPKTAAQIELERKKVALAAGQCFGCAKPIEPDWAVCPFCTMVLTLPDEAPFHDDATIQALMDADMTDAPNPLLGTAAVPADNATVMANFMAAGVASPTGGWEHQQDPNEVPDYETTVIQPSPEVVAQLDPAVQPAPILAQPGLTPAPVETVQTVPTMAGEIQLPVNVIQDAAAIAQHADSRALPAWQCRQQLAPNAHVTAENLFQYLSAVYDRLHTHIYTKCGWVQAWPIDPASGGHLVPPAHFTNPSGVLEGVMISDLEERFNCKGVILRIETINRVSQKSWEDVKDKVAGTVFAKTYAPGLPAYVLYINANNGQEEKRTLVAQNPLKRYDTKNLNTGEKVFGGGALKPTAELAQQGHAVSWIFKGDSQNAVGKCNNNDGYKSLS